MITCKKAATAMLNQNKSDKLPWSIRLHIFICKNCRVFRDQIGSLDQYFRKHLFSKVPVDTNSEDSQRLIEKIKKNLSDKG